MVEVTVKINGRAYELTCGEGEEAHLQDLAEYVDGKITSARESAGSRGDGQLLVLASILIADELSDTLAKIEDPNLASNIPDGPGARRQQQISFLESATARIEAIAARLEAD